MTTPAELLRAFNSMDSSRKSRPLRLVEEDLPQAEQGQEEEQEEDAIESA